MDGVIQCSGRGSRIRTRACRSAKRITPKYSRFQKLSDSDRAAVRFISCRTPRRKDVLEVTRPRVVSGSAPSPTSENPFRASLLHQRVHGLSARMPILLRHRLRRGGAELQEPLPAGFAQGLGGLEAYDARLRLCICRTAPIRFNRWKKQHRHTLFVLERLAEHRNRFTTVTLLTKNPAVLIDDRYVQVLHRLGELPRSSAPRVVQRARSPAFAAGMLFWLSSMTSIGNCSTRRPQASRAVWKPCGSCGKRTFRLSADRPLVPARSVGWRQDDGGFWAPDVQPTRDLEGLVNFSRELAAASIIYSVAKITRPKQGDLPAVMAKMKRVYQHLSFGQTLVFHGGSWRLPENVAAEFVFRPFLELCSRYSIPAKPCKTNLITTP